MDYRKVPFITYSMFVIGFIIFWVGIIVAATTYFEGAVTTALVGIVVYAIGLIFGFAYLRCPHCSDFIGYKHALPDFCKLCGKALK